MKFCFAKLRESRLRAGRPDRFGAIPVEYLKITQRTIDERQGRVEACDLGIARIYVMESVLVSRTCSRMHNNPALAGEYVAHAIDYQ